MSSKLKSWLLLSGIFVVGIVTGSALTFGLASYFKPPLGPHEMQKHWMVRLTHELNLTADQQVKIEPILADAEIKFQSLHREEVGRGSQIYKAADDQISALLTPEQKVQLQKMESEREKMFSGHLHPWGAAHDGSGDTHHHEGADNGVPPPPPPAPPPPPPGAPVNAP